jgi:O-antigen ligase
MSAAVLAHAAVTRSWSDLKSPLLYAVGAYILISFISAFNCELNPKSVSEAGRLFLYGFLFVNMYAVRRGLVTTMHLRVLAVSVAVGAVYGICQHLGIVSKLASLAGHQVATPKRVTGTFSHPLTFAGFYGMAFFLFLPQLRLLKGAVRIALIGILGCTAIAIILSYSRAAIACLFLVAVIYALFRRRYLPYVLVIGAVFLVAAFLFLPDLVNRFTNSVSMDFSTEAPRSRTMMWNASVDFFQAHPVLGIGPGAFTAAYELWKPSSHYLPAAHAHNQYLEALATTGILGFLSFGAILTLIALGLRAAAKAHIDARSQAVVAGVSYAVLFLCLASLFECHFSDEEIFNLFTLAVGFGLAFRRP